LALPAARPIGEAARRLSMTDKADHIAWAAEAVTVFQKHCRAGDNHAIADLICDLGHWPRTLARLP
jgi:hypothetical protein